MCVIETPTGLSRENNWQSLTSGQQLPRHAMQFTALGTRPIRCYLEFVILGVKHFLSSDAEAKSAE